MQTTEKWQRLVNKMWMFISFISAQYVNLKVSLPSPCIILTSNDQFSFILYKYKQRTSTYFHSSVTFINLKRKDACAQRCLADEGLWWWCQRSVFLQLWLRKGRSSDPRSVYHPVWLTLPNKHLLMRRVRGLRSPPLTRLHIWIVRVRMCVARYRFNDITRNDKSAQIKVLRKWFSFCIKTFFKCQATLMLEM